MQIDADNTPYGTRFVLSGTVQGVGMRPFIFRAAKSLGLTGFVQNDGAGLTIEVWGTLEPIEKLFTAITTELPPRAQLKLVKRIELREGSPPPNFEIAESRTNRTLTEIPYDSGICDLCVQEIVDEKNRRFGYPFNSCIDCGPRYSVIETLPFDRERTTFSRFSMCDDCTQEYKDETSRRFHAQTVACSQCGPSLQLVVSEDSESNQTHVIERSQAADNTKSSRILSDAIALLHEGKILAVKGPAGFHLMCDATNELAVSRLRRRKDRPSKPFAILLQDEEHAARYCVTTPADKDLLTSFARPVVLIEAREEIDIAPTVAPNSKLLGILLPSTALQFLLASGFSGPLICTSGNITDEPPSIGNEEALEKLGCIADAFLLNNLEVSNRLDDSVIRGGLEPSQIIRRSKGLAPFRKSLPFGMHTETSIVALGAELKSTICIVSNGELMLTQNFGDLGNLRTFEEFEESLEKLLELYETDPEVIAVDLHPEYRSSKLGKSLSDHSLELLEIQHHHAHIAACLGDNEYPCDDGPVLGFALDGLGMAPKGEDEVFWGGELVICDYNDYRRIASIDPVPMPGGFMAISEPWRSTYAHLRKYISFESLESEFPDLELTGFLRAKPLAVLDRMQDANLNSPLTSSCGRLFDAVSAALGLCRERVSYEGEAAVRLESIADPDEVGSYTFIWSSELRASKSIEILSPSIMWRELLTDLSCGVAKAKIAAKFHNGLAKTLAEAALNLSRDERLPSFDTVALGGGVMQNALFRAKLEDELSKNDFRVLSSKDLPANDGAISFGQALIAASILSRRQRIEEKNTHDRSWVEIMDAQQISKGSSKFRSVETEDTREFEGPIRLK